MIAHIFIWISLFFLHCANLEIVWKQKLRKLKCLFLLTAINEIKNED
jgi:tryptophan-rich sensory protein